MHLELAIIHYSCIRLKFYYACIFRLARGIKTHLFCNFVLFHQISVLFSTFWLIFCPFFVLTHLQQFFPLNESYLYKIRLTCSKKSSRQYCQKLTKSCRFYVIVLYFLYYFFYFCILLYLLRYFLYFLYCQQPCIFNPHINYN